MKQQVIRDEVLLNKYQLVVRVKTTLIKDDFGNDRQRISEIYFVNDHKAENLSVIGFTPAEFEIIHRRFQEWLLKHGEV